MPYKDPIRAKYSRHELYLKNGKPALLYYHKNKIQINKKRKTVIDECLAFRTFWVRINATLRDRTKHNINSLKHYYKLKNIVYNHYSNYDIKCNCCGEREILFLTLEHLKKNGKVHRNNGIKAANLFNWIIQNNFPTEFEILCMNCNHAKAKTKENICPHKIKKEMYNSNGILTKNGEILN